MEFIEKEHMIEAQTLWKPHFTKTWLERKNITHTY